MHNYKITGRSLFILQSMSYERLANCMFHLKVFACSTYVKLNAECVPNSVAFCFMTSRKFINATRTHFGLYVYVSSEEVPVFLFFLPVCLYSHSFVQGDSGVPVPSHIYLLLVKCASVDVSITDCVKDQLDILSFVLPHRNQTDNCLVIVNIMTTLFKYHV